MNQLIVWPTSRRAASGSVGVREEEPRFDEGAEQHMRERLHGLATYDAGVHSGLQRGGKREAQRTLAALVVSVGRELSAPEGPVTVGELVQKWFAHAKADFSPKTRARDTPLSGPGDHPVAG
jgi:hypothetical protein